MTRPNFGRLIPVNPRQAWQSESDDFTPWLTERENLTLLGKTIGIELEFEAREKSVGPFRADILCRDTTTGDWVLIENQLERTDHTHLGQLITYAAGLRAVTIVWVANPFTEEHRAALDWMNDITDTRFNFFGLEVELWKIGDSPLAPKFNVVSKPNDWSKTVAEGVSRVELSETQQLQLDFWTAFRTYASEHAVSIKPIKPLPQGWMGLAVGRTGFGLHAIASLWNSEREHYDTNEVRAELQISNSQSHSFFALLETEKDEIHAELGFPLTWYAPPDQKMKKIYARRDADLRDRKSWEELQDWLTTRLDQMKQIFGPRIQRLEVGTEKADKRHATT